MPRRDPRSPCFRWTDAATVRPLRGGDETFENNELEADRRIPQFCVRIETSVPTKTRRGQRYGRRALLHTLPIVTRPANPLPAEVPTALGVRVVRPTSYHVVRARWAMSPSGSNATGRVSRARVLHSILPHRQIFGLSAARPRGPLRVAVVCVTTLLRERIEELVRAAVGLQPWLPEAGEPPEIIFSAASTGADLAELRALPQWHLSSPAVLLDVAGQLGPVGAGIYGFGG